MDEYISKKAALDALGKNPLKSMKDKGRYAAGRFAQWKKDKEKLESLTVADVVEVVRCKDCENWDSKYKSILSPDKHYCVIMDKLMKPDGFCSYGEKAKESRKWI